MRLIKSFENFERPYRKIGPKFSEDETMDIGNTLISALDDFCEKMAAGNQHISHDEITIGGDGDYYKTSGPKIQWFVYTPMNLTIDIYTTSKVVLDELYSFLDQKFVKRLKTKFHIFTFKKYERHSDIDIRAINDQGQVMPNVWIGQIAIVIGKN